MTIRWQIKLLWINDAWNQTIAWDNFPPDWFKIDLLKFLREISRQVNSLSSEITQYKLHRTSPEDAIKVSYVQDSRKLRHCRAEMRFTIKRWIKNKVFTLLHVFRPFCTLHFVRLFSSAKCVHATCSEQKLAYLHANHRRTLQALQLFAIISPTSVYIVRECTCYV